MNAITAIPAITAPSQLGEYPLNISADTLATLDSRTATLDQVKLLAELLGELKEFELGRARCLWRALAQISHQGELTIGVAGVLITRLISQLRTHREVKASFDSDAQKRITVPDGRYAVRGDDNVVRFYRLATSKGRKGYQNVFVYASDEQHLVPLKVHNGIRQQIVAAGIDGSATLFGIESAKCYKCGRRLTDENSRALGVGPECIKK